MLKAQMKNCRSPYLRGKGGSINWSKDSHSTFSFKASCTFAGLAAVICIFVINILVTQWKNTGIQSASQLAACAAPTVSVTGTGPVTLHKASSTARRGLENILHQLNAPHSYHHSVVLSAAVTIFSRIRRISLEFLSVFLAQSMLCPFWKWTTKQMLIKITNLLDEQHAQEDLSISRTSATKLTPFMLLHSSRVTTEQ